MPQQVILLRPPHLKIAFFRSDDRSEPDATESGQFFVEKDGQIGSKWATSAIIRIFMISDRTNI